MHARDILSRPVVAGRPGTPLTEAIEQLTECGFAALTVVDDDRVIGLLYESDALAASSMLDTALVEIVMSVPVEVVQPSTGVATIAYRMLGGGLRSMPIVESGILVGIVARRDLLRALIRDDSTIESKTRALLDDYAGSRRNWAIGVEDGRVRIHGTGTDPAEQRVIAALARTVDGVTQVEVVDESAAPRKSTRPRRAHTAS
ncbi:CBS domain-containing protein [Nocardia vinacea]|uniref:CBS domain-containing protein n=1 Tax=Nocardia vinacea TaxID=96468 RepID=UPI0033D37A4A